MEHRVKLIFPEKAHFSFSLSIRVTDLNYGGHMGNECILKYAQEARMAFFANFGASEKDFFGTSMIQADAMIQYLAEGYFNDIIQIDIAVVEPGSRSFNLFYKMTNKTRNNVLAFAKTGMVCFDYNSGKTTPIPEKFLEAIS